MDPVAELMIAEATATAGASTDRPARRVAVLDAPDAVAGAADLAPEVRAHCDSSIADAALRLSVADEVVVAADPALALAGADLVLLGLPKAQAALAEWCELIRAYADPDVRVIAGARIKHLRPSMNDVLGRDFAQVRGSLGRRKARVLHATGLHRPGVPSSFPRRSEVELDLPGGPRRVVLHDHGSTFARGRVDPGTRLLLGTADRWRSDLADPAADLDVIDLGCGDGVLAVVAALTRPGVRVLAVDDSAAAIRSAAATASANGAAISTSWSDGLTGVPDGAADLIVCNPPYHQGTTKDSTPAMTMLADAGRVLRPGGELWTVFNSHLPYLPLLRSAVGPSTVAARDRSYTVIRSTRR